MFISKIILDGYKRFRHLTIELGEEPSRIVALIGPNGCGKSSIFDGMLYKINCYDVIGNKGAKGVNYHSIDKDAGYNHQKVSITFNDGEFDTKYRAKQALGKQKTLFSFRNSYRYNSSVNVKEMQAQKELRENYYGATQSTDLDDKMTENYKRLYSLFSTYFKTHSVTFEEAKRIVIGELNTHIGECLGLSIVDIGDILDGNGTLFFEKPGYPTSFEFDVLSSGEKEVVDILLDIYLRKDIYDDTIYIIDEPELHLNTAIQRKLLTEINKLIPVGCQIWVATHSIGFLRALQDDLNEISSVIEFTDETQSATTPMTLHPISKTRANRQRIFSTALDDLTGLVAPKRIIYCEGKPEPSPDGKELGFDAIIYNQIFAETHSDTHFVSSAGCGQVGEYSSIALTVLSKVFVGVELYSLLDRDNKTETERTTYIQSGNKMLSRYSIENFLLDKEIVAKAFPEKYDDAYYDGIITDIISQKVKSFVGPIMQKFGMTQKQQFIQLLVRQITPGTSVYQELESCIF